MITSNSREREAEIQRRLIDVIAAQYDRKFRAEITRQSLEMIATFEATGSTPTGQPEYEERMRAVYRDLTLTATRTFGARILNQGKAMGLLEHKDLSGFAEFFARVAEGWINAEMIRQRIVMVTQTTRNQIVQGILEGQRQGLGTSAIGNLIRKRVPLMSRYRANLIARTETHGAANNGADAAARHTGLDLQKEWISTEDHRTRDFGQGDGEPDEYDHRSMNGQKVDMDQPFLMPWRGGDPLRVMFPGDAGLPPAATINCRCAVAHSVKGLD